MTRFRLYTLAALCGALLMALEILASRIIAPYFGNSVYIWGSIISVFLGALSVGYSWGGRLADRQPDLAVLGRLIFGAGLWLLGLRLVGAEVTEWLADLTAASPAGTLLAATVLFGVPSVLFGTVSPFVIRLAAREMERLGDTAGRLFAVSTMGSLAGTLLCTFVAIPNFRVTTIAAALTVGTAGCAVLALAAGEKTRVEIIAASLLALAGLSFVRTPSLARGSTLGVHSSAYQTIEVIEVDNLRYIKSDRVTQSAIYADDLSPASSYAHYAPAAFLLQPEIERVLAIGMGGGLLSQTLRTVEPDLEVDYVEIDSVVPKIAEKYGFWTPRPSDRVHIADGRQFVRHSTDAWDYIYVDAYIGLAVPFHLTTSEFFQIAAAHLEPGGVIGINLAAGLRDPFSRAVLHTLRRVFRSSYVIEVGRAQNVLLLATQERPLTFAELRRRAAAMNAATAGARVPLTQVAAKLVDWQYDPNELIELRDDYAPAEHLVLLGDRDFDLAVLGRE